MNPANTSQAEAKYEATYGVPWFNCTGEPPVQFSNTLLQDYVWFIGVVDSSGVIADGDSYMPWMAVDAKYVVCVSNLNK